MSDHRYSGHPPQCELTVETPLTVRCETCDAKLRHPDPLAIVGDLCPDCHDGLLALNVTVYDALAMEQADALMRHVRTILAKAAA